RRLPPGQYGTGTRPERGKIASRAFRHRTAITREQQSGQTRDAALPILADDFATGEDQVVRHLRRSRKECTKYRRTMEPDRRLQQASAARDERALGPLAPTVARDDDLLPQGSMAKRFAGKAAAEAGDVPTHEARVMMQVDTGFECCDSPVEDDGFLGQPFERRLGRDRERETLFRHRAGRAVPLGGARRGQLCPRAYADRDLEREPVATGDPRWRMHDDALADRLAFRVEGLLHHQRPT